MVAVSVTLRPNVDGFCDEANDTAEPPELFVNKKVVCSWGIDAVTL